MLLKNSQSHLKYSRASDENPNRNSRASFLEETFRIIKFCVFQENVANGGSKMIGDIPSLNKKFAYRRNN